MITQFTEVIESNNFLSKDMNTFISEDDIYCNFDKFEHGETHVCFVTGISGSGKSTLSKKLARKYNANYIELDIVMYALDKMRERAGGKDKARQRLREEHPWIYEWIMNTHQDEETWPKLTSEKMSTYDFHINKTMELIDWLRQTKGWSTGKPPRFIIDGVDLVNIIPMRLEYTEYPFIFKGTSKIKAALRRAQREGGLKNYYSDVKGIIELIKAVYGDYYWATSMQADQTAGRYMTINRDSSNAKEVDEDSLTAKKMGIIFSDDDIHYNVHRFLNKEVPVLWITGMSGGGKSTLAGEMADKAPGVISLLSIDNLDDFVGIYVIEHDMKTINKWRKDKVYDIIYKFIKANEKLATDAFNDTHNKKWQDFVTTVLKYVVKFYTPKKQIIIEGVQIPYVYYRAPELFGSDSAIIIKGTSVLTSIIRRYHRDQDRGWFINKFSDIKKYFDMYSMWYRTQNDFRNHVTPNMESYNDITKTYANFKDFCKHINTPAEVLDWYKHRNVEWPTDVDPNMGPFSYPDDIIKKGIGNCWDHALFMYAFCKVKGIPAAVLGIACYYVNRRVNEWWRYGHKICAFKDKNGWYLFNYFPNQFGNLFGPYKTKEDAAKAYSKYYYNLFMMNIHKGNPLNVREYTKAYYKYSNVEEDYILKHMNDHSFSQMYVYDKFAASSKLSKYDDLCNKPYKDKNFLDWVSNIKETIKMRAVDWLISKEGYIAGYDTFKVHPQTTEYTCGPACVMMVLDYYGMLNGETEASLTKELDTDWYSGTHVSAIEYYFKCKGWTVNSSNIEGSPSKYEDFKLWLDYNLSHNNPIMVENKALDGHWRVIIGFDEDNDTLLVADPYTKINDGINVINAHDFFTTWYDTINNSVKAWVTAKPPK